MDRGVNFLGVSDGNLLLVLVGVALLVYLAWQYTRNGRR